MINKERLNEIFMDCLFKRGEDTTNHVMVDGVTNRFSLHPSRVNQNKKEISTMVDCLPKEFDEGYSFLEMCVDSLGNQWTGLHNDTQELLVLGIAIGRLEYTASMEFVRMVLGGIPYIRRISVID